MTSGIAFTANETANFKKKIVAYFEDKVLGTLTEAIIAAGVGRTVVYEWKAEDKEFSDAIDKARKQSKHTALDFAQRKLMENISNGGTAELIFFLKTQGKELGYVERQESTYPDGAPQQIVFVDNVKASTD